MKTVRGKLAIGQSNMYAGGDKQDNVINNLYDIVKAAEDFYTGLYSIQSSYATFNGSIIEHDAAAPSITSDEVGRALQDISRRKAAGEDGITVDLIKDGGDITLEKLAAFYALSHVFNCS